MYTSTEIITVINNCNNLEELSKIEKIIIPLAKKESLWIRFNVLAEFLLKIKDLQNNCKHRNQALQVVKTACGCETTVVVCKDCKKRIGGAKTEC